MSHSSAYLDYLERFRQVGSLLLAAKASADPIFAGAASKGAIVLAAAALERFMNDAVREACQRIKKDSFAELSGAQQAFLCAQIARRISSFDETSEDYRRFNETKRIALKSAVQECSAAFGNPSTWPHIPEFGLFMDGAAAPDKVAAVLRDFSEDQDDVYSELDKRSYGRATALRALTQLIDARHDAAHAKSMSIPSPSDAQSWIVNSFWITRLVEFFLLKASGDAASVV